MEGKIYRLVGFKNKNTARSVLALASLVPARKPRKPQQRAALTRSLLLRAAEQVFARVGYEKAQVEQIAKAAGFSKGALYAHFRSKEELFLALYQDKEISALKKLRHALDQTPTREGKLNAFRKFYIDLSKDKEWALIGLEVKLLARRYPAVKEKFRRKDDHLAGSINGELTQLLGSSVRAAGEALGGIYSALVLEADLEPAALSEQKMRAMLAKVFDALLELRSRTPRTRKARP